MSETERAHEEKQILEMLKGTTLCVLSMIIFFLCPAFVEAKYINWVLVGGIGCFVFGICDFTLALYDVTPNIRSAFRKLRKNKKGIAWIWVVAAITIGFMPFIYWGIGLALDEVFAWNDANYTFTGSMNSAYILGRTIVQLLPVFVLFGVLLWSIINSKASAYGGV